MGVGGKGVGGPGVSHGVYAVGGPGVQQLATPLDIPGLVAWWDADDRTTLTLNSGAVATWRDKSGNGGTAAQPTEANQPAYAAGEVNGRAAVDFSVAAQVIASPSDALDDIWDGGGYYIGVVRKDTPANIGRIFSKEDSDETSGWRLATGSGVTTFVQQFSTTDGTWSVSSSPSGAFLIEVEYNSGATTNDPVIRINGAALSVTESSTPSGTRVSDASNSLYIGNRAALFRNWDGPHCEHALFTTIPTAGDKAALRRYLSAKWGVPLS